MGGVILNRIMLISLLFWKSDMLLLNGVIVMINGLLCMWFRDE